jgi:hypothetical protein
MAVFSILRFSILPSQFPTVPRCPRGVPRSFGTANLLIGLGLAGHETHFWYVLKKHLSHTCGTNGFLAEPHSLQGRDEHPDQPRKVMFSKIKIVGTQAAIGTQSLSDRRLPLERRLPACNEREARTSFLGKPARSKGETLKSGLCRPLRSSRLRAFFVFFSVFRGSSFF